MREYKICIENASEGDEPSGAFSIFSGSERVNAQNEVKPSLVDME